MITKLTEYMDIQWCINLQITVSPMKPMDYGEGKPTNNKEYVHINKQMWKENIIKKNSWMTKISQN